jgi:signal transduction histidine kinase
VQEALNNSIKHSECTRIDLQLIRHNSTLTITIEDNGKGFNKNEFDASSPGFGLRNIEIRCKAISGEFNIETSPGRGTALIVELEEI